MIRVETKTGAVQGYLPDSPSAAGLVGERFSAAGTRQAPIPAGTDFTVPPYTVGTRRLEVFLDGLRCISGEAATAQYAEVGETGALSTLIRWHDAIPPECDILARVL